MSQQKQRIIETFNRFSGKNFDLLRDFYSRDVFFQDPVGQVSGLENLQAYYEHAYKNVQSIRFDFGQIDSDEAARTYYAPWTMTISLKGIQGGKPYCVEGLSKLQLDEKGLVCYHRDYLDLGELIYERIPVLNFVLRLIKKMLKA